MKKQGFSSNHALQSKEHKKQNTTPFIIKFTKYFSLAHLLEINFIK
jgi:hypothetical protein